MVCVCVLVLWKALLWKVRQTTRALTSSLIFIPKCPCFGAWPLLLANITRHLNALAIPFMVVMVHTKICSMHDGRVYDNRTHTQEASEKREKQKTLAFISVGIEIIPNVRFKCAIPRARSASAHVVRRHLFYLHFTYYYFRDVSWFLSIPSTLVWCKIMLVKKEKDKRE